MHARPPVVDRHFDVRGNRLRRANKQNQGLDEVTQLDEGTY